MPNETDRAFGTTYAELYDRYLVPLLFEPYAGYLADRAKALNPRCVLETAAGTGVLTEALARSLPTEVPIMATDLNPSMIDRARTKTWTSNINWQQADAVQLPFPNESFDLIICQFGVMFFPDKQKSFRDAARVLIPQGHYLFAVWDDWGKMPDAPLAIAADAVAELLGCDSSSLVIPPYHDEAKLQMELEAAQFEQIKIERVRQPAIAASAREAAFATVHGSLIRSVIETKYPGRIDEATNAVEQTFEAKFDKGAVAGWTGALIVTAAKSH